MLLSGQRLCRLSDTEVLVLSHRSLMKILAELVDFACMAASLACLGKG